MALPARTLVFCAAAAAAVAILSETTICLHAQEAGGGFTIRAETRVVLVDAVATDKKGKFVRDLAANDFQVWEDGKEQKISGFSLESAGVSPERPAAHYIAMFFDTSTADQASQVTVRQQGMRFIDGFASSDRYMAVVNYNMNGGLQIAQNFTTDRDRLKKAVSQVPAGWSPAPVASARSNRDRARSIAAPVVDTSGYRNMLSSLRSLVDSLAVIRGRKALVLFTSGIPASDDLISDIKATIDACNKANVAVYTVDSGTGDNGGDSPDAGPSLHVAQATNRLDTAAPDRSITRSLSEGTGGLAFLSGGNLAESLGKIAQEQDQYYLLSYTPSVDSAEGSCHELRVKVERKGLEVRARKGYCTSKPADALSGKPAGKDLETRATGAGGGNMTAKMQLPWFYSAPGVARVDIAMDIVPSGMKFEKEKGKLRGEFDLAGVAYKPDGSIAARVSDAVKLEFDSQQQVDAFLKAPYHYQNQFEIAPGQYTFRMAFSSDSAGAHGFGKVEMPLRIDPWNGQTLSMSGLALSHDAHPAADLAADLDVSLLEGPRPLLSRGMEAVPAGTLQFHASGPGYFYFETYEPLLAAVKAGAPLPVLGVRVRLIELATGQQKYDTGFRSAGIYERAGNPIVPIVLPLPLPAANLPIGRYRLEVGVARESGAPMVRTADFEIN